MPVVNSSQTCKLVAPCVCTSPGQCPRHNIFKTEHTLALCQSNAKMRKIWDQRAGLFPVVDAAAQVASPPPAVARLLTEKESRDLFGQDADDPTLIGNRIAALTVAIGIPPCGGCNARKEWFNRAHAWLRGATQ